MKYKEEFSFKTGGVWAFYPDPEATHLYKRWWHKFMFWRKFNYGHVGQERTYKSLKDFIEENSK